MCDHLDIEAITAALQELRSIDRVIERLYWLYATAQLDPHGSFEPAEPDINMDIGRKFVRALGIYGTGEGAAQTVHSWIVAAERQVEIHGQIARAKSIFAMRDHETTLAQMTRACRTLIDLSPDATLCLAAQQRLANLTVAA